MESNFRKILTMILALTLVIVIPSNVSANGNELSYTEIISPQYEDARTFSEGLAAVKQDDKWGYINESGEVVIDFQYDRAYSFSEGKALVEKHVEEDDFVIRYYYIITPDNESVQLKSWNRKFSNFDYYFKGNGGRLEEMYDTTFYNGYILVPADSATGKFIFDEYGQAFDESIYLPTEGTLSKYDHYSELGNEENVSLYDELGFISARPFNQGMAPVAFEDTEDPNGYYYTFLKDDGTLWSGPKFYDFYVYDITKSYQLFTDHSLASVMNAEGKWGAVNKEGETIIPFIYESLRVFSEGLAPFSQNGKFGFIDIHGNEVIKPQFDDASGFLNGLAVVRQGNTAYIIDKQGNKVKGSENIPVEAYFVENGQDENGDVCYIAYNPGEYVVITDGDKYGVGKITNSTPEADPYEDYNQWSKLLEHNSVNHSWTITLNMNVDETTVNNSSVSIIDKDNNTLDFIDPVTENIGTNGSIKLKNNGSFKKGETYWIIIEDTIQSVDGQKLKEGMKAPFKIN